MGTGMCSRRQKGLLQTAFCLLTLACLASGVLLYNHLQQKVRNAEALAQKYKQQQEALSAQLQVVYEHRSRLERSLQKERGEHKKTKEDFLVYKLEAQEALNKEKQDSMNRYGALSSQHKILKNQHDDVKKQLLDLQLQHNSLKLEHRKSLESQSQKLSQLQQQRDSEVASLQDTVFKLREESKLLRKAHQEVHSQLLNAQAQMEEFRQLKEALQKMPGLRGGGGGGGRKGQQPLVPASSQLQPGRLKALPAALPSVFPGSQQQPGQGSPGQAGPRSRSPAPSIPAAPGQDGQALPEAVPAWPAGPGPARFTRTMNSLPRPDVKMLMRIQVRSHEQSQAPGLSLAAPGMSLAAPGMSLAAPGMSLAAPGMSLAAPGLSLAAPGMSLAAPGMSLAAPGMSLAAPGHPSPAENPPVPDTQPSAGTSQVQMQSWKELVSKVNAQLDEEQARGDPRNVQFVPRGVPRGSPQPPSPRRGAGQAAQRDREDEEELEMDAGVIGREDNAPSHKQPVVQEPMMPDDAADPAQDPNNQGEDEFEEAELERPDFEEKVGGSEKFKEPRVKEEPKEKPPKDAGRAAKPREDPLEDYQEDQEQEIEDHGGEVDDNDDLELAQERKGGKKDDYF